MHHLPKVEQPIQKYEDCKKGTIFFKLTTCQLLNSLDTVGKINKSKLSGFVNVFTLVPVGPLVVVLLLPPSLAMGDGKFDRSGGGGGSGGPVAAGWRQLTIIRVQPIEITITKR